jgi:serine/threonine protein kinase
VFPSAILSDFGQYIRREIITHAQLRHPNVIEFLGVFREDEDKDEAAPLIILPFLEKGSALCYLNQLSAKELLTSTSSIVSHFSRIK